MRKWDTPCRQCKAYVKERIQFMRQDYEPRLVLLSEEILLLKFELDHTLKKMKEVEDKSDMTYCIGYAVGLENQNAPA